VNPSLRDLGPLRALRTLAEESARLLGTPSEAWCLAAADALSGGYRMEGGIREHGGGFHHRDTEDAKL
jgi:hypothetical protein